MAGPWYIVVNGVEVDIDTTYGTYTTGMVGFGMPPLTHNVYDQALTPGAILQNIKVQPRVLQLEIGCRGTTLAAYHSLRKLLVEACKPNYGGTLTAVELRYDGAGTKVKVYGYYDSGLQGQRGPGNKTPEMIALRFLCYDPWFYAMATTTEALDENAPVANADGIMRRIDGTWANISTEFDVRVYALGKDTSGGIYAGGDFTDIGDANGDRIIKWNPATEALSPLSTGIGTGVVNAIISAPDGGIYVGGAFTDIGDANGDRIVKWNGSAWSSLDTGIASGIVYALAVGQNGTLYAGGTFTNHVDGSGDYITSWNGTAWSSLGTGMNGDVNALTIGPNGDLYATGSFTTAGGVTVNGIAKWNGTTWAALGSGTGINIGAGNSGKALMCMPDGSLYLGGSFTSIDGVAANYVAKWNGTTWEPLGSGLSSSCDALGLLANGLLIIGGSFTSANGNPEYRKLAAWNGTAYSALAVYLPDTVSTLSDIVTVGNDLYLCYDTTGTAYASGQTTVTNGTAAAYPTITIKRVGGTTARVEYLKNETTDKVLYLDYSLLDGETLTLTFTPGAKAITSDFFGNVIGRSLLPNSDFAEWCLQPGANVISLYVYEAGSPTVTASMAFVAAYWSVDGVAA